MRRGRVSASVAGMTSADGIRDEEVFSAWLDALPRGTDAEKAAASRWPVILAHRAVMRVLPSYWGERVSDGREREALTTFAALQCALAAGVAGRHPTPEIRAAALAAHNVSNFRAAHRVSSFGFSVIAVQAAARAANGVNVTADAARAVHAAAIAYAMVTDAEATRAAYNAVYGVDVIAASNAFRSGRVIVASGPASAAYWREVNADCTALMAGEPLDRKPLRSEENNTFTVLWSNTREKLLAQGPEWQFWVDWYDKTWAGAAQDWQGLLTKVALIDGAVWGQGPAAVAAEIARIEAEIGSASPDRADLGRVLSALPAGRATDVAQVRRAFAAHRAELPPTFDAVLGFITLEVERLQVRRNYRDADDAAEARRQIGVLTTLYQAVEALKALVPGKVGMTDDDAEKAEKLARLFARKFQEWPRANADELVDNAYRCALVGATTVMLPMIGVTTPYAFAAGLVWFGRKGFADAEKMAKDALKS